MSEVEPARIVIQLIGEVLQQVLTVTVQIIYQKKIQVLYLKPRW